MEAGIGVVWRAGNACEGLTEGRTADEATPQRRQSFARLEAPEYEVIPWSQDRAGYL